MKRLLSALVCSPLLPLAPFSLLWAQLDDSCTVSVLNRNVGVRPDGTWAIPNIPANQGRVRARATCVENGITRFGQSSLFVVPANGAVNVAPIQFGDLSPIPDSVTVTASSNGILQP